METHPLFLTSIHYYLHVSRLVVMIIFGGVVSFLKLLLQQSGSGGPEEVRAE